MQNKISIHLIFKDYEFRRVKMMGGNPVLYTTLDWVGKEVLIIPMPFNVTDRYIESLQDFDETLNETVYDLTVSSDTIIKKTIKNGETVGRVYVPKELIGLDCLIIEAPFLNNF